jgi:ABC-type oligopeptide transport system ATPase subunit
MPLLEIRNLKKYFPVRTGLLGQGREQVKAIDGVSFDVGEGETVGLVGESGCGKTTLGRCLVRLIEPTAGTITFEGRELSSLPGPAMREIRRRMQIVFQDPYAALNPRMRIGEIIGEGLSIHGLAKGPERKARVVELLTRVGLRAEYYGRYPHEFSGGQRQRIGVARALAVNAKFIVADEAVSALDVSIQVQILNMLLDLQQELGLTYLGRRTCQRPRGGDVSRQDCRDRYRRKALPGRTASLHAGAAFRRAGARPWPQRRAHGAPG